MTDRRHHLWEMYQRHRRNIIGYRNTPVDIKAEIARQTEQALLDLLNPSYVRTVRGKR